ncbi:MAG: tRNA (adenosine(37)-N6)-dimethylallyltransferase MiaA [Deltaproteobacteria bacterium]|jgi:tRNA dimethylallyltransferase|nr:tRNA (adenosine(37)-N6)-dimethylallyltransferase MiaA [Deltaproteobacteria bacterium]
MPEPAAPRLVAVTGPTGSGKTALAAQVAARLGGAVINADSLAFYRGLDIGAAKPTAAETALCPHHLFGILDPDEPFDAAAYARLARPLAARLWEEGSPPVACGGTGLYLRTLVKGVFSGPGRDDALRAAFRGMEAAGVRLHAVLESLDHETAARLAPGDRVRVERALEVVLSAGEGITALQARHALSDRPFEALAFVIDMDPGELDRRLRLRTERMFATGLLEETRALLDRGYSPGLKPLMSIGYREAVLHLAGGLTLDQAKEAVYLNTRRLAKRQRTWFRGQLPEGRRVPPDPELVLREAREFLRS